MLIYFQIYEGASGLFSCNMFAFLCCWRVKICCVLCKLIKMHCVSHILISCSSWTEILFLVFCNWFPRVPPCDRFRGSIDKILLYLLQKDFLDDILGCGLMLFVSPAWLSEVYSQIISHDLLKSCGCLNKSESPLLAIIKGMVMQFLSFFIYR